MADSDVTTNPEGPVNRFEPVAGPLHTVFLLLALTAVAAFGFFTIRRVTVAENASHLRFYLPTIAWEWLVVGYIYWGLRRRGKSFRDIAGERWKSAGALFIDVALGFGFWISALVVLGVVSYLVHPAGMQEIGRRLAPRDLTESLLWIAVSVTAGICEETIFRGYLQRQFVAWTRNQIAGVILSAVLFGAGHIYQGGRATIVIAVYGLLFGILAEARKNLRPGMMVHAWHDSITGLTLETLMKHGQLPPVAG